MLSYLVTEIAPGIKAVTVTGQSEAGTFADGVVAIVTETSGEWKGRGYKRLPPGWYHGDGEFIGTTQLPTVAFE